MGIVGAVILIIGAIIVPVFNDLFEKILIQVKTCNNFIFEVEILAIFYNCKNFDI